jgi:hypothetical protein
MVPPGQTCRTLQYGFVSKPLQPAKLKHKAWSASPGCFSWMLLFREPTNGHFFFDLLEFKVTRR